jgi:hypothetical protein
LKHALNLALDDERRDKEKKNREDFRRTDHFVRACRNEERELLIEAFRAEQVKNPVAIVFLIFKNIFFEFRHLNFFNSFCLAGARG